MNGLPPVIKEDIEEEIRDEDLPVLPYKSKNKTIINIEGYISNKPEEKLKNKNSIEEVINKDIIQSENSINKDVVQNEELIKENIIQVEKSTNETLIQENKSNDKELEGEKIPNKEKGLNFDLFNKEYDEMFPPLRPEDSN
jgi:hypothetical protein